MPDRARPLSPHLGIYRWQIGNSLSILHRITGASMSLGLLAMALWLVALATDASSYALALRVLSSPVGLLALVGWTFAFFYHLGNGVRHLFWDAGRGFERAQRRASGWTAVGFAIAATAAVWVLLWRFERF